MHRIVMFAACFFITAAGCAQKAKQGNYVATQESVSNTLKFLSSDELAGRDSGSEGIEKAAVFLEDIMAKNNLKPYFATYRDTLSNFAKPAYNIVGWIEGTDPKLKNEFVVIGAHYDHIGTGDSKVKGDTIYNGADDNATGSTAVAELINYFGSAKNNKRSIMFCFFSAEEKGLLGSKHLAEKLHAAGFNIYTMLNFEMIGVPLGGTTDAYITGMGRSNMADKLNEYAGKKMIGANEFEMKYQLFRASDNYPFFTEFNIPAHTVSTTEMTTFPYYHHPDDEFENMDTAHMADFINKMIPVVEKMVNAKTKEIVLKN